MPWTIETNGDFHDFPSPFVSIVHGIRHRDIYSPAPVGLSSQANEVIVLPLAFIASLFIHMN